MKKLAILLAACLLLLCFAACNNDDEDYTITPTVFPEGVVPIEFDENGEAVLWASDAYAYDEPIILENDDMNFGGWVTKNSPAAYWCVNIPETGDYALNIVYSRADEGEVAGWLEEEFEGLSSGQTAYFESTGDWSAYSNYSTYMFDMDAGTHMLTLRADDEDTDHFINLESIILTPYVEEESAVEEWEPDGEAPLAGTPLEGATFSVIALDDVYYHHDSSNTNYQFSLEGGTAQYNGENGITVYDYAYDGNMLILQSEGETVATMEIIDPCTLLDTSDGSYYTIPDSEGTELAIDSYYYMDGGIDNSIVFRDDGTLTASGADGTEMSGTYTNEGGAITIEADGNTAQLYIVNRRVLYTADGVQYLMLS